MIYPNEHKIFNGVGLILILLTVGCEQFEDPVRTFITKKGEHYASPKIVGSLQSRTLIFEAKFNETAVYDFGDPALQSNKNKLVGFSECNSLHHDNSARFAWQWFNNRLEIYAYCYVNGNRVEQFIGVVNLHEFNRYRIDITNEQYVFILNDSKPVFVKRVDVCDRGLFYMLWPYFGGHVPAPHDVIIEVKMNRW